MSIWGSLWAQFAYWRSPHHHFLFWDIGTSPLQMYHVHP
jgi:hypothetical protein